MTASTSHAETVAALCAAIDADDDSLLPILADALEDAGDARAAGLRTVLDRGLAPHRLARHWCWHPNGWCGPRDRWPSETDHVSDAVFARLKGGRRVLTGLGLSDPRGWRTRSAAYLALAQALTETDR